MIKLLRDENFIDGLLLCFGGTLAAIGLAGVLWVGMVYP